MNGTVFSIEEFSTFDGPGIRTTVFLKGCLLRCGWCHNPEGQRTETEWLKNSNGCIQCGKCFDEGERVTGIRQLTAESATVCPRNLIRRSGECFSPEQLCGLLLKNAHILASSGGGITFSGGEPLYQHEFLAACLDLLSKNINCALQTSGYAEPEVFDRILEHLDYVMYDVKIVDTEAHKRRTGVSNEKILRNYRHLAASGVSFVTRIPLIPGVTDTEENLSAVAALMRENGAKYVELLPYNRMAGSKYRMDARVYRPDFDEIQVPQPHKEIFETQEIYVKIL
jgi:pyruvate formate lyase activating enzyme